MSEEIKILEDFIIKCRQDYYNDANSVDDDIYDQAEQRLRHIDPTNKLLTMVGASVRGGKIKLPLPMGSLDQVYNNDLYEDIIKLGHQKLMYFYTAKIDGTSIMLCYDKGQLYSAYSRGDGYYGADVTRHVRQMKNVPKTIPDKNQLFFRGEVVLPKDKMQSCISELSKLNKKEYKNGRNCVAGQMNREESFQIFYDNVDVIVYDIMNLDMDKDAQLQEIGACGFKSPQYDIIPGERLTQDNMTNCILDLKENYNYEIDGIVIEYIEHSLRKKDYSKSLNPSYAKKFKITSEDNIAITVVKNVSYNISKDNYLKPVVNIEPVDLMGVTISNCTGFNGKFIMDHKIGKNSIIKITRSGDVIPHILEVVQSSESQLPTIDWKWSTNMVDFISIEDTDESNIQKLLYFYTTLNITGAKIGNITKLYENGITNYEQAIKADINQYINYIGNAIGTIIYNELHSKLQNGTEAEFASAIQVFGRGISIKKLSKLVEKYDTLSNLSYNQILETEGFSDITALQIYNNLEEYNQIIGSLKDYIKFNTISKPTITNSKGYIIFTGVRDKQLEQSLINNGYEVGDSLSKMTLLVAKDVNGNSNKITKAKQNGIKVISLTEAYELLNQ